MFVPRARSRPDLLLVSDLFLFPHFWLIISELELHRSLPCMHAQQHTRARQTSLIHITLSQSVSLWHACTRTHSQIKYPMKPYQFMATARPIKCHSILMGVALLAVRSSIMSYLLANSLRCFVVRSHWTAADVFSH